MRITPYVTTIARAVTGGAVVLAVTAGALASTGARTQARYEAAMHVHAAEVARLDTDDAALRAAVAEARRLLADTDGTVAYSPTRTTLAAAIAQAERADDAAAESQAARPGRSLETAEAAIRAVQRARTAQRDAGKELSMAVTMVGDSHATFVLDQAVARAADARTALDAAVGEGERTLADTAGRVPDDAVRQDLRDALAVAAALPATPRDESVAGFDETAAQHAAVQADVVARTAAARRAASGEAGAGHGDTAPADRA
ncbi:hypothetical protein ET495_16845 [Xylanimonas allomyrinae]|uniref:Uncharacterized protein n=1 Tax=Xylanimonas allomyrinae TaxID=2509459 RepID=A0A4P6ENX9_9MICO|nr:hypothetical protein [Xylanimonas allomyrinae]QAY64590.1 hypothetical protein ET495_16845 [Xylanimonas allomyrinae]